MVQQLATGAGTERRGVKELWTGGGRGGRGRAEGLSATGDRTDCSFAMPDDCGTGSGFWAGFYSVYSS